MQELEEITARSLAFLDLEARRSVPLPVNFGDVALLEGYELDDHGVGLDGEVKLVLYWRVAGPVYEPLSSFAHLLDERSSVVGQYDGFDVPPWHWEPGAVIAQVYRFRVSPDAQPGIHWLEVGLYNPQTLDRVQVFGEDGAPLGDRLLLERVLVQ